MAPMAAIPFERKKKKKEKLNKDFSQICSSFD
jgi:hypothetical protein